MKHCTWQCMWSDVSAVHEVHGQFVICYSHDENGILLLELAYS